MHTIDLTHVGLGIREEPVACVGDYGRHLRRLAEGSLDHFQISTVGVP